MNPTSSPFLAFGTLPALVWLVLWAALAPAQRPVAARTPNIIFILADDLGYRELGSYGQQKIRTPHLDRLSAEGMRFTQFYSGSPVCAPTRASLLTGKHTGHSVVRDNYGMGTHRDEEERGNYPLPPDEPNVAKWLKERGYTTAIAGKWGLGGPGTAGVPTRQGFDFFYGYLDQKQAHNYYPTHLWRNEERIGLRNEWFSPHQSLSGDPGDPRSYDKYKGVDYSPEFILREALRFIEENRKRPFFLYFAPTLPHVALQVPDEALKPYLGRFPETPYTGDRGYLPHPTPRAAYAAMITYLDAQVGRMLDALKAHGLDGDTVVFFTSDNGAVFNVGGADPEFFDSVGELRGYKGALFEGGIRVPLLARWPGHIAAGSTTSHVAAVWDMWATFADMLGVKAAAPPDGISILPTLLNRGDQTQHEYLYWEYPARGGSQAVRMGWWKGIRRNVAKRHDAPLELYDLEQEVGESADVARAHPAIVKRIDELMRRRTPAALPQWNFVAPPSR
jgi:arylsulfatase A